MLAQWDDPLDAIAVHAFNGTWGVIAPGLFASADLITNAYGLDQNGNVRPFGCFFPGSNGHLLAAQIAYTLWIAGACPTPIPPLLNETPLPLDRRKLAEDWLLVVHMLFSAEHLRPESNHLGLAVHGTGDGESLSPCPCIV